MTRLTSPTMARQASQRSAQGSDSDSNPPGQPPAARDDEGMATVEYALVTVAAAAFAAVLIAIVKSPEVRSALASIVSQALSGG